MTVVDRRLDQLEKVLSPALVKSGLAWIDIRRAWSLLCRSRRRRLRRGRGLAVGVGVAVGGGGGAAAVGVRNQILPYSTAVIVLENFIRT